MVPVLGVSLRTGLVQDHAQLLGSGPALQAAACTSCSQHRLPTRCWRLQEAGVAVNEAGAVSVDDFSRTSVPGIWAVGDVTARLAQTPVAIAEAMAFARSCLGGQLTSPDYTNVRSPAPRPPHALPASSCLSGCGACPGLAD